MYIYLYLQSHYSVFSIVFLYLSAAIIRIGKYNTAIVLLLRIYPIHHFIYKRGSILVFLFFAITLYQSFCSDFSLPPTCSITTIFVFTYNFFFMSLISNRLLINFNSLYIKFIKDW